MNVTNRDLTTKEASERLGVSDIRVRQLCQAGELPGAEKRGRDWMIPEASVAAYKRKPPGWPAGKSRKGVKQ